MNLLKVRRFDRVKAVYEAYPLRRYRGNPLVEALGISEYTKDSLHTSLGRYPPEPTNKDRMASDFLRQAEVDNVLDVVYARPAYRSAVSAIVHTTMNAYALYHPLHVQSVMLRHDLAALEAKDVILNNKLQTKPGFVFAWRGTAGGYAVLGSTGSGKTTLLRAIADLLGKVIQHKEYHGRSLGFLQIPVLQVSIPHDATIRAFILQFAAVVDYHLGEPLYEKQARSLRTIADAALLMIRICAAISLGALIVDDLQNLRVARGPGVEVALNLLALLIDFGTSVITSATPALGDIIKSNARNTRKLVSSGYTELRMMPAGSTESRNFQDALWKYRYTSTKTAELTPKIRQAWEQASAGNPAFSTLAWKLVQCHVIGEKPEAITPDVFEYVAHVEMALLKPAIDALNSNDPKLLAQFDDLIFKEGLKELFAKINVQAPEPADDPDPFDDEGDAAPARPRAPRPSGPVARQVRLPSEDPMSLMTLH